MLGKIPRSLKLLADSEVYLRSDPPTFRHFEALGIRPGWSCLEIGGGGGSIARWLSQRVGENGRVVVTDIDPRFLEDLRVSANVEVLTHDITKDELPKEKFDLVHARLVLIHLPEREQVLEKMISSTKPGGWVIVEDFDLLALRGAFGLDYHPKLGEPPTFESPLFRKLWQERQTVLQAHGADLSYARNLHRMFLSRGLKEVRMEGFVTTSRGGGAGALLDKANFLQSKNEMLATGIITEAEFEKGLELTEDPEWLRILPLMISVWGRK